MSFANRKSFNKTKQISSVKSQNGSRERPRKRKDFEKKLKKKPINNWLSSKNNSKRKRTSKLGS